VEGFIQGSIETIKSIAIGILIIPVAIFVVIPYEKITGKTYFG
jgi:hypothetical protein